ncbi:MAG: hypothetical protein ABIH57_00525 [Candidatus Omnitrophota bacterium]
MNAATGTLTLLGLILLLAGLVSKFLGMLILAPFISSNINYVIAANTCFLLAIVVDKFQKN